MRILVALGRNSCKLSPARWPYYGAPDFTTSTRNTIAINCEAACTEWKTK